MEPSRNWKDSSLFCVKNSWGKDWRRENEGKRQDDAFAYAGRGGRTQYAFL